MDHKNFYENLEEAGFRLNHSVVLYDGKPVFVQGCEEHKDGIIRVNIKALPYSDEDGKTERKMINSPKFNRFRPAPLGNLNFLFDGMIIPMRLERLPARTHTQGLTARATTINPIGDPANKAGIRIDFNGAIRNEGFIEMCQNIYPTVEEFLKTDLSSCCVHQDITISRSEKTGMAYVWYKVDCIGLLTNKQIVFLFPKFGYLKELFETTKLFRSVNKDTF